MMMADLPPDVSIVGHRCRTYPRDRTNEDTVAALRSVAEIDGAWCEIDTWTLADGTRIVFHDTEWRRVADPHTLPRSLPKKVKNATWDQVRKIRTRGGEKIPRLKHMLRLGARLEVPLIVEVKNTLGGITDLLGPDQLEDVWFYQTPSPTSCKLGQIDALAADGATVGVKTRAECPLSPEEIAEHGSFVADKVNALLADDAALTQAYLDLGLTVLPQKVGRTKAPALVEAGVKHLVVNHPSKALSWEFPSPS